MRTVQFSVFLHTSSLSQNRSMKDDDAAECSRTACVSKSGAWASPRLTPSQPNPTLEFPVRTEHLPHDE